MNDHNRSLTSSLPLKLALSLGLVLAAAMLIVQGILSLLAPAIHDSLNLEWHTVLMIGTAMLSIAGWSLWMALPLRRRLRHMLDVSLVWLRGNLAPRLADSSADELGQVAEQMNLLAEQLSQDEQDLNYLREQSARLGDQARALTVVEERNHLARELHDGVKQYLFSLSMTAGAIRARLDATGSNASPEVIEMAREAEMTAQTAQREITRLIENLRPGSLQDCGLAAALNDYALVFGAREHLLIYLDVQGNDALIPPPISDALYRVAQEALHNVAHHARATRVNMRLRCIPEQAELSIRDNGRGFDTTQASQGLGLPNMQERLMAVGGRLTVESRPGMGATVLAEVGLTRPLEAQSELVRLDKERPVPTIENWAWLGQKLVIPVGQTWPWQPADEAHLRRPLIEPEAGPLAAQKLPQLLHIGTSRVLQQGHTGAVLARIQCDRTGFSWRERKTLWSFRRMRGIKGRGVLLRNNQPLAATQYQGRLMNTWSEFIYDGGGYRLSCQPETRGCVLLDQTDDELLKIQPGPPTQITLCRPTPLPLVVMAVMRYLDDI